MATQLFRNAQIPINHLTMRYVICYDITNNKRRRLVVKILEGMGYRVQYSVFECDLTPQQFKKLRARLRPLVKARTNDSIRYYPLCAECLDKVHTVGQDLSVTLGVVKIIG